MFASKKNMTLLLSAIGFGVAAALLSVLYLHAREAQLRDQLTPKQAMTEVVVASRDLLKGDVLDSSTLSVRSMPADYVDTGAVKPGEFDQIKGQVLVHNLASGRPLLHSFIDREFPLDFSDTIPLKRRAMTIQVDEVNSVSGFVRPGDRIDLFVNLPAGASGDNDDRQQIIPLLENTEVLATGTEAARDYEERVRLLRGGVARAPDRHYTALTLNVTAREAAILATAQDKGDVLAVLRNRKDTSGSGFTSVSPSDLKTHARQLLQAARTRAAAHALSRLVVGKDGVVRTADGKVVKGVVVAEDGTIMSKDGVVLSGRGLQVDDQGRIVTADGKVIDPATLKTAPDGALITADGTVLTGAGSVKAGKLHVTKDGLVVTENGTVLSGVHLNKGGKLVLKDGTVVDPKDVVIRADGTVLTRDGKVLKSVGTAQLAGELHTTADGQVTTANGTRLTGASLDKDGMLVLKDGTRVDPNDVVVHADGTVTTRDGRLLAGVSADNVTLPGMGATTAVAGNLFEVDYIVGGVSKDSVATVNKVPVLQ